MPSGGGLPLVEVEVRKPALSLWHCSKTLESLLFSYPTFSFAEDGRWHQAEISVLLLSRTLLGSLPVFEANSCQFYIVPATLLNQSLAFFVSSS